MRKKSELSGRYGLWTVIRTDGALSSCKCECGIERTVRNCDLTGGRSRGCGCTRRGNAGKAAAKANKTHGLTKTSEYRIWTDMRRRCGQPNRPDFKNYGGRGISVCERWVSDFSAFYADMGKRPKGRTLERRDNNGPYSPDNCYWATQQQQDANKRTNTFLTMAGEIMTISEAAARHGISKDLICWRLKQGWPLAHVILPPHSRR